MIIILLILLLTMIKYIKSVHDNSLITNNHIDYYENFDNYQNYIYYYDERVDRCYDYYNNQCINPNYIKTSKNI